MQWHPPLIRHHTNVCYWSSRHYRIWLFTEFREVSIVHLQRERHAIEDAYSSGHQVLSHFGTCNWSNVETNLSWICLVSGLYSFEHPSVLLSCFQLQNLVYQFRLLALRKFHGHYWDLINQYEITLSQMLITFWGMTIYIVILYISINGNPVIELEIITHLNIITKLL